MPCSPADLHQTLFAFGSKFAFQGISCHKALIHAGDESWVLLWGSWHRSVGSFTPESISLQPLALEESAQGVYWYKTHGSSWISVGPRGPLQRCVGLYDALWVSVGPYGAPWVSIGLYGSLWGHVGLSRAVWVSMRPYGAMWVSIGLCGSL